MVRAKSAAPATSPHDQHTATRAEIAQSTRAHMSDLNRRPISDGGGRGGGLLRAGGWRSGGGEDVWTRDQ